MLDLHPFHYEGDFLCYLLLQACFHVYNVDGCYIGKGIIYSFIETFLHCGVTFFCFLVHPLEFGLEPCPCFIFDW